MFFLEISASIPHVGEWDLAIMRIVDIGVGCLLGSLGTIIATPKKIDV